MLEYSDKYFTDNYFCKDGRINSHKIKHLSDEELEWLNNRYDDSFSLYETLQRIKMANVWKVCSILWQTKLKNWNVFESL